MIAAASMLAQRSGAFPRWLAIGGLIFAPLLAISDPAFRTQTQVSYHAHPGLYGPVST